MKRLASVQQPNDKRALLQEPTRLSQRTLIGEENNMANAARDTRSNPTPKYIIGEKVLCYEPDPSKARVMYEAKVCRDWMQ